MNKLPIETKKDRLVVYEKTLKELLKYIKEHNLSNPGLCIALRDNSGRSFPSFPFTQTDHYFPEFGECYNGSPIKFLDCLSENGYPTDEWRLEVLNYCIEQCQSK